MNFRRLLIFVFFTIVHSTAFSQLNWQTTNGPEGGAFWNMFDDGQYAYASDEYYFYRCGDGLNWEQMPTGTIWPLGTSPTKLAAGQGFGYNFAPDSKPKFVVSYDHGATWIEGMMPPVKFFYSIAVCTHGVYVSSGSSVIFRTQDDGLTWDTILPPGTYCHDVWAFDDRLYAESSFKYYRLATNGIDWEPVSPSFDSGDYPTSMFASDSLLFFSTEENYWCSSNYGATWTKTPIQQHNNEDSFCKIGNRVYKCAGQTGFLYTDDFGHHWQAAPVPGNFSIFDLATSGGQLFFCTYNKGVFRFDVANQNFVSGNKGLYSAAVYAMNSGNGELWAACGNGVFAYDLAQEKWVDKALLPVTDNYFVSVAVSPTGKVIACPRFSDHFYLSLDDGATWDTIVPSDANGWSHFNMTNLNWVGDHIIAYTESSSVTAWSTDLGQTWKFEENPGNIVLFQGRYYGLKSPEGLVSSDDFGQSWHQENGPNIPTLAGLYATDDRLFVMGMNQLGKTALYSSPDAGSWTYSSDGIPQINYFDTPFEAYQDGVWHNSDRYYFYNRSTGFFTSLDSCKTWLPTDPYTAGVMQIIDSTIYGGGFGAGVNKAGLPQNFGAFSTGYVFNDSNNNGIWDPNEAPLPNMNVSVNEPNAWYQYWFVYSQPDGYYAIGTAAGAVDTLQVNVPSAYVEHINPPQHIVSSSGSDRNFGVHFLPDITDVSITGNFAGRPRSGFLLDTYIEYRNEGTIPADGTVSIKLDPKYHFVSASPAPSAVVGPDSLIWNFSQTPLFDRRCIIITGKVDSSAVIGSLFKIRGHVEPTLTDFKPVNNHFMRSDSVRGSFDPNEKRVEPAGGLTPDEIAAGKELVYTIQFQNTGNFQAERVRITDPLDSALNIETLRLVASSHPVSSFRLLPGNLLEITFEQITLPDSNSNEAASHGFVSFAIQRNKAFNSAYVIRNTAAIYFDYNEPVFTNTVLTPVATHSVSSFEPNDSDVKNLALAISPNPTEKDFVVDTRGVLSGPGDIVLIDAQGKISKTWQLPELSRPVQLNVTGLSAGAYVVRARAKSGVLFGKLVVSR